MKRIFTWVFVAVIAAAILLLLLRRNPEVPNDSARNANPAADAPREKSERAEAKSRPSSSERPVSSSANPSYFIVSHTEMGTDLEGSTNKILKHFFGLELPASARNFGTPRHNEFQMDPDDASQLLEDIKSALEDLGPYEGKGTYLSYNPDKWKRVTYGGGQGMPPGQMIPNLSDGPYEILYFMPKLEGRAKEEAEKRIRPPVYEIRINPGNGFATMSLSSVD